MVTAALCVAAAPRQRQRIHVARTACTHRLRTGIARRPGSEHVVNQRDARRRRRASPYECTGDILDTTGYVEQRLLPGRLIRTSGPTMIGRPVALATSRARSSA